MRINAGDGEVHEMNSASPIENSLWLRDLHWVMGSPFLMNPGGTESEGFSEMNGGEASKSERLGLATGREEYTSHRVGYYFESLVYHWLKEIRQVEILAHGQQIVQHGKTLGELDFVFRDETGRLTHWEVAAKFYLHLSDGEVLGSHYIGSNAGDTFELKRDKIFSKQLPLSEKLFPECEVRKAFVKGRIFYHWGQTKLIRELALPAGMASHHLRGIWLRYSELSCWQSAMTAKVVRYHLIAKPHWLSACYFSSDEAPQWDFQTMEEYFKSHFSQQNQPLLISVLSPHGDGWEECERMFVVAARWPEQ
ncbi:MAG: DUF1853 family protein [Verrucomicrobiales bacterium]|nr:DUF1853 family protein [Verrucomicrobiales bacterium]